MTRETILVVDDERSQCALLKKILEREAYRVVTADSAKNAIEVFYKESPDLVLSDLVLGNKKEGELDGVALYKHLKTSQPDLLFILVTAYGTIQSAVAAVREGIDDYITKPVDAAELLKALDRAFAIRRLRADNERLYEQMLYFQQEVQIVGKSPRMLELMETIRMVARSDATVLIRGESGTGKELAAITIHANSRRRDKAMIKVSCGALPETLLESELFGHERGAFTGAEDQRKGRFELADGGTIFLDEIAEIPPHVQVKLLRVLQERQFERLGSSTTLDVDVRVIASTHRNLEQMVADGRFREDLYYRINVVPIVLPPLRERREDIILLAEHFIRKYCEKDKRAPLKLSAQGRDFLMRHNWPGNVRELENCIERAVVLERSDEIQMANLTLDHDIRRASPDSLVDELLDNQFSMEDFECKLLERALVRARWNQSRAAALLGLTRRTLQYRMEKYSIAPKYGSPQDVEETY